MRGCLPANSELSVFLRFPIRNFHTKTIRSPRNLNAAVRWGGGEILIRSSRRALPNATNITMPSRPTICRQMQRPFSVRLSPACSGQSSFIITLCGTGSWAIRPCRSRRRRA